MLSDIKILLRLTNGVNKPRRGGNGGGVHRSAAHCAHICKHYAINVGQSSFSWFIVCGMWTLSALHTPAHNAMDQLKLKLKNLLLFLKAAVGLWYEVSPQSSY